MTRTNYRHAQRRARPVTQAQVTAARIALAIALQVGAIAALILIGTIQDGGY